MITLINQVGCGILRAPRKAILGRDWFDGFLPASERCTVRQQHARVMAGQPATVERSRSTVLRANGEPRLTGWHSSLLRDADHPIVGLLCSGEDITEQQRLVDEPDRLVTLTPELICIAGVDGRFKYLNPYWEHLLGYPRHGLLSRPFLDFIRSSSPIRPRTSSSASAQT